MMGSLSVLSLRKQLVTRIGIHFLGVHLIVSGNRIELAYYAPVMEVSPNRNRITDKLVI